MLYINNPFTFSGQTSGALAYWSSDSGLGSLPFHYDSGNSRFYLGNPSGQSVELRGRDVDVSHGMTSIVDTDVFMLLGLASGTHGGVALEGYSDAGAKPMLLRGNATSGPGTASDSCIVFEGRKKSGTSATALASSEKLFAWYNGTTFLAQMLGDGSFGLGTSTPRRRLDALDAAGCWLRASAVDNTTYAEIGADTSGYGVLRSSGLRYYLGDSGDASHTFFLRGSGVAHGMTSLYPTDVYGAFQIYNETSGGLQIFGLSDTNAIGLMIDAASGQVTSNPPLYFRSFVKSGSSVGALGASNPIFTFQNQYTRVITGYGDGSLGLGTNTPRRRLDALNAAGSWLRASVVDNTTFSEFGCDTSGYGILRATGSRIYVGGSGDQSIQMLFRDTDVAHGITSVVETDVYGRIGIAIGTTGGLVVDGFSDDDNNTALYLRGYMADATPDSPAVVVSGRGKSGTSFTDIASNKQVAAIWNNSTAMATWLGSGYMGLGQVAPATLLELEENQAITGDVTDGYSAALTLDPAYAGDTGTRTVTRHNYIDAQNVAVDAEAAVTDACFVRFDAAAGTHKAVDAGTTKTTPGTVDAWVKVNVNGTIYYTPLYTSKTT